jgi:hypothetical protein
LVAFALEHGDTWNRPQTNYLGLTYDELKSANKHINALKQELKVKGIIVK